MLYDTVVAQGAAVVLGRSGSGKSSLARAGLLPRLRSAGLASPALGGLIWDSLVLRPGDEPLVALAGALSPPRRGEDEAERYFGL